MALPAHNGAQSDCALRVVPVPTADLRSVVRREALPAALALHAECATAAVDDDGRCHGMFVLGRPLLNDLGPEPSVQVTYVLFNEGGGTFAVLEVVAKTVVQALGYPSFVAVVVVRNVDAAANDHERATRAIIPPDA